MGAGDNMDEVTRRVREGLPVLEFVARRLAKRLGGEVPLDDLMALGRPALLEVARTFDPSRAKFSTFAGLKVKWAILDGVRREAMFGRSSALARDRANALAASARFSEGLAEMEGRAGEEDLATEEVYQGRLRSLLEGHAAALALGLTAGGRDPDGIAGGETPEESASREELRRAVAAAIRNLPEREHALIERHYFGDEAFDSIARDLGISKSWASRLHASAIQSLARSLRGAELP
jgi:RNA polymerase sigma factor for flagellar operon FliA